MTDPAPWFLFVWAMTLTGLWIVMKGIDLLHDEVASLSSVARTHSAFYDANVEWERERLRGGTRSSLPGRAIFHRRKRI
jgi:hypothetical protein